MRHIKWWEKTVEYKFVVEVVGINSFIAPLDGKEEVAGDAIFGDKDNLLLIEFKKDSSSISSEKAKFHDYEQAKKKLKDNDQHHLIIYGEERENTLILKGRTYFSEKEQNITDKKMLPDGEKYDDFISYLKLLIEHKKTNSYSEVDSTSNSGGFGIVVGVSTEDNQKVKCMSLQDFVREQNLNLNVSNKIESHLQEEQDVNLGWSRSSGPTPGQM